jgi:hypothetical protein
VAFLFANVLLAQQLCLVSAGVKHMGSKVHMDELEKLVKESNNQELVDEIGDVKILYEKSVTLREGFFVAEADALDKRIHAKLEKIHAEATRSASDSRRDEDESEDEDRDERKERMKAHAKKHRMNPPHFDEVLGVVDGGWGGGARARHKHRHEQFMNDAMRQDGRHDDGRDIHDRHKDLLTHRHQDFKKRLEKAQFSAEEEAAVQDKIDTYLALEREVMNSRMGDRSKEARAEHRKKSKEERDAARDEMKIRRHEEKEKMHEARQMRKDIDTIIREKMSGNDFGGPELR